MVLIDRLSAFLAGLAMILTLALTGVMLIEVVSRYAFNAPTLWAGDLSYMLNGAIFMFAAAYGLKKRGHVQIDFISSALPRRLQDAIMGCGLLVLFVPAVGSIGWIAVERGLKAFASGEVEAVSAWQPLIWPFHAALAAGLVVLALQGAVEGLRALMAVVGGRHD